MLGLPLAVFAKENGILTLAFLLLIEWVLFDNTTKPRLWRVWCAVFLIAPLVCLVAYLLQRAPALLATYETRPFSLGERLLTESRIVAAYLGTFFAPAPAKLGLFFDDYTVSKSLISPLTTLFSMALHLGWITAAIALRKRYPILCLGILWFYAGHLLESTALPLELYFLHRNYLPFYGLSLLVAAVLVGLLQSMKIRLAAVSAATFAAALLIVFALISFSESKLWGDTLVQAKVWAKEKPFSKRAQDWYATTRIWVDDAEGAASVYRRLAELYPDDGTPHLLLLGASCYGAPVEFYDSRRALSLLRSMSYEDNAALNSLSATITEKENGVCQALPDSLVFAALEALSENQSYQRIQPQLEVLRARLHLARGDSRTALRSFDDALARYNLIELYPVLVQLAISEKRLELARRYLLQFEQVKPSIRKLVYQRRLAGLRSYIQSLTEAET
jgi:hypothetical protein